jgi:hypothetical protein
MNLYCDIYTPAQEAHRAGSAAVWVATLVGGVVVALLLLSRIGIPRSAK